MPPHPEPLRGLLLCRGLQFRRVRLPVRLLPRLIRSGSAPSSALQIRPEALPRVVTRVTTRGTGSGAMLEAKKYWKDADRDLPVLKRMTAVATRLESGRAK